MKDIKVTLIGSFRKDRLKLESLFKVLNNNYELLSPVSIEFVEEQEGFAKTEHELNLSIREIEEKHLKAIKMSDIVVLHAPDGYVGLSGAFEIGVAHALGIPVIADAELVDNTLAEMITEVVEDVASLGLKYIDAGKGLSGLQNYYQRTAERRGWGKESPRDTMLLLTEEIGELARAIRKAEKLERDAGYNDISIAEELADVQLYLVHLANTLGIELSIAVTDKEVKNHKRHSDSKKTVN